MQGDPFGVSFSPAGQQGPRGAQGQGGQPSPVQQAIQTLSLRIPKSVGAGGIAPDALLNSGGGGGLGGPPDAANMLELIKRMLFGNQSGQGQFNAMPMPGRVAAPGGSGAPPNPGAFQPPNPPPYLTPSVRPIEQDGPQAPPAGPPPPAPPPQGGFQEGVPNNLGNGESGFFRR